MSGKKTRNKVGIEFEQKCIAKLEELGFERVKATSSSGDYGADIIADFGVSRFVFQCKFHKKMQGVRPVYEVNSARYYYEANRTVVISCSNFTEQAKILAEKCFCLLLTPKSFLGAKTLTN